MCDKLDPRSRSGMTRGKMLDNNKQKEQIKELLKIHYGFDSFRPGQAEAIDSIIDKKDTIVVMPTGSGKSLIYQLPALVLDGVTIVISPLIALMKNQVDFLEQVGIPACFINSSISPDETKKRLEMIKEGYFKLLYIAPERFYNRDFVKALTDIKVSLFAIDEAHCISQWGHDFRPSYMRLKDAIELVGRPPVVALTATATPEVKEDIIKQLDLKDTKKIITGFARPNLQFGATRASDREKLGFIMDAVRSMEGKCGIIYVGTRGKVEKITNMLLESDIEATAYHAGMDIESRTWAQDSFLKGKTKVIVATNAFGLGIDKKDIRFIIHHDLPGTVEAYYQEAGRAGRDGKPSFCLLFYSPRDRYLREFFIKGDNPSPETILEVYDVITSYGQDRIVVTYAEIMESLTDDAPDMAVGTSLKILEKEGYLIRNSERTSNAYLRLANDFKTTLDFVSKKAKKQIEILEKLNEKFGDELISGWELNLDEVAGMIEVKRDSLIRAINSLKKNELAVYNPPKRGTEINILKRVDAEDVKIDFKELSKKAKRAYGKLDQMEEYVFHYGCRQKYILDYFSDVQAKKCGKCDNCLMGKEQRTRNKEQIIRRDFDSSGREIDRKKDYRNYKKKNDGGEFTVGEKKNIMNTKLTQLETLDLYIKGCGIKEIAEKRGLTDGTVSEHLCFLIEKKLIKDIDKLVDKKKQERIKKAFKKIGADKLKPIKEELGDSCSYEEIKIIKSKGGF